MAEDSRIAGLDLARIAWPPAIHHAYDVKKATSLGSGGYGVVYKCRHFLTNLEVAIKVLDKRVLIGKDDLHSVQYESIVLRRLLRHPHIVQLIQVEETEDFVFFVLEYLERGDLVTHLSQNPFLTNAERQKLCYETAVGLLSIHQSGFATRDLKPDNVMLTTHKTVKLIDFGLAAPLSSTTPFTQTCCGTKTYTAPEVLNLKLYRADSADLWSLGCVFYCIHADDVPFSDGLEDGELDRRKRRQQFQLPPWTAPHAERIILGLLEYDPAKRLDLRKVVESKWFESVRHPDKEICQEPPLEDNIVEAVAKYYDVTPKMLLKYLLQWRMDEVCALYQLLAIAKANQIKTKLKGPCKQHLPSLQEYNAAAKNITMEQTPVLAAMLSGTVSSRQLAQRSLAVFTGTVELVTGTGIFEKIRALASSTATISMQNDVLSLFHHGQDVAKVSLASIHSLQCSARTLFCTVLRASAEHELVVRFEEEHDCTTLYDLLEAKISAVCLRRYSRQSTRASQSSFSRRSSAILASSSRNSQV
eukprot:m.230580 g.230580  ORF g.230580 m.230580 type:complete len:530 (+) comp17060_c7_seq2:149-1738(+)